MGSKVPDLRGLFLRGQGGNSGKLLQHQSEAIHISSSATVTGEILFEYSTMGGLGETGNPPTVPSSDGRSWRTSNKPLKILDMEININSGNETRPVNMAVRYLIRALP